MGNKFPDRRPECFRTALSPHLPGELQLQSKGKESREQSEEDKREVNSDQTKKLV